MHASAVEGDWRADAADLLHQTDRLNMIVVLGGHGFVAQAFGTVLSSRQLDFELLSRSSVDYSRPEVLRDYLHQQEATFLINAAGYTGKPNVDACELHKTECLAGNAVLPGVIGSVCDDLNLPWGHVSSGCIYTGVRADGTGFKESDPPNFDFRMNNGSFYSGSKALGEEILAGYSNCFIWRLRIPFDDSPSPRNYLVKLLNYDRLLDARNSFSYMDDFINACLDCWTRDLDYGIYNLTNPGSMSTREVVAMMIDAGLPRKHYEFFESEEQFMQEVARTPRSNCILDSSKAIAAGLLLRPIKHAFAAAIEGLEKSLKSN